MLPPSDLHPVALFLLVGLSFAAVLVVTVLLVRSGRSVDLPDLSTKFRPPHPHPPGRGHHVSIR
jgi:hypothetical protein